MNTKRKVVVLLGGTSTEREVSLVSGAAIANALIDNGHEVVKLDPADFLDFSALLAQIMDSQPDLVFLGLHGGSGENGMLQAALELSRIPFTGSGHKACALTMDKYIAKLMAVEEGIPIALHILMRGDYLQDYQDPADYAGIAEQLGLPLIVKPNDGGSSVGISKVEDLNDLKPAVVRALEHSDAVLIESWIPGRELTVTVLDGKALPVVEIRPKDGWYDYTNKYQKGKSDYLAPAPLEEKVSQLLQMYAERLWKVFDLKGYARIDFRFDGDRACFLEVNTLPGMTPLSLTPMAAKSSNIDFADLVEMIMNLAVLQERGKE